MDPTAGVGLGAGWEAGVIAGFPGDVTFTHTRVPGSIPRIVRPLMNLEEFCHGE